MGRLVIHCEIGRSFWVGEARVTLMRVDYKGHKTECRVAIDAPKDIHIKRDTVVGRIAAEESQT